LLPSGLAYGHADRSLPRDFVNDYLALHFAELKAQLGQDYPTVFLIMGNDDPRSEEPGLVEGEARGLWKYIHNKSHVLDDYRVYGYAYVPPTPFMLKDWERYDVSRYVDPGCVHPKEGSLSVAVREYDLEWCTIKQDLEQLVDTDDLEQAIFLFHSPPYKTALDRAALDGKKIDSCPLDVHVGSIAIERFIKSRQPLLTLHGHIHESTRLTGEWREYMGRTHAFNAAHDGTELCVVRFELENLDEATRELI
jgi:Icc-related predicted phosphoesterase